MAGSELSIPYLSFVTSSRNDDHGSGMFKRMQTTLSSVVTQLERFKINSEIVLVDYNPPADRPLLKDQLSWPSHTEYCTIRTIVVPTTIHKRYKISDKLNFNGWVAQNVGLRRARGEFVLLSPIDNLFSNELLQFISKRNLERDKIYRTDRCDVPTAVLEISSLDERLSFCRKNIIWIHTRYGSVPVVRTKKHHLRSRSLNFNLKSEKIPTLHTNGPDLLLMAKEAWFSLRGFPEIDAFGLGFDSLPCYMAYLAGIQERILPESCCIYHIDHDSLWRDTQPSLLERVLFYCFADGIAIIMASALRAAGRIIPWKLSRRTKIESLGFDHSTFDESRKIIIEMQTGKRCGVYNDSNWGLGNEDLEEYYIVKAGLDNQKAMISAS